MLEFWIDTADPCNWSHRPIKPFEGEPNRVVHLVDKHSYDKLQAQCEAMAEALDAAVRSCHRMGDFDGSGVRGRNVLNHYRASQKGE